jgi:hypothetical protein
MVSRLPGLALRVLGACLFALFATGCGPHYVVVRQASPNPFAQPGPFAVAPVSFANLVVDGKPEDAFLAGRDPDANARWDADKQRVATTFAESLKANVDSIGWVGANQPGATVVVAHVTEMHGGVSLGLGSTAAHISMEVQLVRGGQVLDEIKVQAETTQGESGRVGNVPLGGYTGSERLRKTADKLGGYVASYLESRTGGVGVKSAPVVPDTQEQVPSPQPIPTVAAAPAAPAAAVVPDGPAVVAEKRPTGVVVKGKHPKAGTPAIVATFPGFEILPDGGSRVFVELTRNTTVTEKREARLLTYVLHGAQVRIYNNEHALVTVHFNTPVSRARIYPVHGDVVLSIELRADAPSTYRMVEGGDGSTLQVDFPKGSFLAPGEYVPVASTLVN